MFSKDMGIDLGTANTLVYMKEKGIIVNEPSVVAINTQTKEVLAVGNEAKDMIGRTPGNIVAIRPMKDGVIADFDVTQAMLRYFINKAYVRSMFGPKPRIVICVPSGVTEVEKRAVMEAAVAAGSKDKDTYLIEEPMAASIGAGLPVADPTGSMVVDIGGGTADIAVISLGGVVESASIKVAGDQFNEAVVKYMRRKHNILVGDSTAEKMKIAIGCVYPREEDAFMDVKGRCLLTGLPKTITVSSAEMMEAFEEPTERILESIHAVLERTPPELVADVSTNGIMMTGGGSLVYGFDKLITSRTGIATSVAENAIACVAEGTGRSLDMITDMQEGTINLSRRRQVN